MTLLFCAMAMLAMKLRAGTADTCGRATGCGVPLPGRGLEWPPRTLPVGHRQPVVLHRNLDGLFVRRELPDLVDIGVLRLGQRHDQPPMAFLELAIGGHDAHHAGLGRSEEHTSELQSRENL